LIEAVTFDLWNTLIENRDYTDQRIAYLIAELGKAGHQFTRSEVSEAVTSSLTYVYRVWETENRRFVPNEERLDHILGKLRVQQLPEDTRGNIVAYFEEVALPDHPRLLEGVKETLECLRPRFKMGIISDSGFTPARILRKIVAKNGILDLFDTTLFSDETGYNKPHRVMFETVLSALSAKPSETLHVGDLLQTDVAGAKAFGMKAAWLNREGKGPDEAHKPDFSIRSLREIVDVLDRLGRKSNS